MSKQPDPDQPYGIGGYLLSLRPDIGEEFVVRVLNAGYNPSREVPFVWLYVRPANKDGETVNFCVTDEGEFRT